MSGPYIEVPVVSDKWIWSLVLGIWRCWYGLSNSSSPSITSSFWKIRNIFSWLELLNNCHDGWNRDFQYLSYFLTVTYFLFFVKLNNLLLHQIYILWFHSLWRMIKGIWPLWFLIFVLLWIFIIHLSFIFIIHICHS